MTNSTQNIPAATAEINAAYSTPRREAYAALLDKCVKAGLFLLSASFLVYLCGWLEPQVPIPQLPQLWKLPVADYLRQTGMRDGWYWLANLGRGDLLNFAGIAFLCFTTIFCYLRVLPFFIREKDYRLAVIAILEILVLLLAASGILAGGH